jgi:hypothetical protein
MVITDFSIKRSALSYIHSIKIYKTCKRKEIKIDRCYERLEEERLDVEI